MITSGLFKETCTRAASVEARLQAYGCRVVRRQGRASIYLTAFHERLHPEGVLIRISDHLPSIKTANRGKRWPDVFITGQMRRINPALRQIRERLGINRLGQPIGQQQPIDQDNQTTE